MLLSEMITTLQKTLSANTGNSSWECFELRTWLKECLGCSEKNIDFETNSHGVNPTFLSQVLFGLGQGIYYGQAPVSSCIHGGNNSDLLISGQFTTKCSQ